MKDYSKMPIKQETKQTLKAKKTGIAGLNHDISSKGKKTYYC
jgi:hypothetical protein